MIDLIASFPRIDYPLCAQCIINALCVRIGGRFFFALENEEKKKIIWKKSRIKSFEKEKHEINKKTKQNKIDCNVVVECLNVGIGYPVRCVFAISFRHTSLWTKPKSFENHRICIKKYGIFRCDVSKQFWIKSRNRFRSNLMMLLVFEARTPRNWDEKTQNSKNFAVSRTQKHKHTCTCRMIHSLLSIVLLVDIPERYASFLQRAVDL